MKIKLENLYQLFMRRYHHPDLLKSLSDSNFIIRVNLLTNEKTF